MRIRSAFVFLLAVAACARDEAPAPAVDAPSPVVDAALAALDKRTAALRDYEFDGTATDVAGKAVTFHYAFAQPTYAAVTVGQDSALIYDGTAVTSRDLKNNTSQRQELKDVDDAQRLLALHNMFSAYASEGWRPPLLRKKGMTGRVEHTDTGDQWVLRSVVDDADIAATEVRLRVPTADFLGLTFVDKNGGVVLRQDTLQEFKDPTSGFSYPQAWKKSAGADAVNVVLTNIRVNAGIPPERFSTAPTAPAPASEVKP